MPRPPPHDDLPPGCAFNALTRLLTELLHRDAEVPPLGQFPADPAAYTWDLQTDGERYLARMEKRLARLQGCRSLPLLVRCMGVSGHGGGPRGRPSRYRR